MFEIANFIFEKTCFCIVIIKIALIKVQTQIYIKNFREKWFKFLVWHTEEIQFGLAHKYRFFFQGWQGSTIRLSGVRTYSCAIGTYALLLTWVSGHARVFHFRLDYKFPGLAWVKQHRRLKGHSQNKHSKATMPSL